jgi:large subunit ribosomal protein L6|uniref:ribosomal protein L6 n=1 Tax=Thalassionema frauenfeldii TaxID=186022 RepID=UPI001EE136E6|nr:ribosomal protein L6 [Thalassionema frauenfeldii]UHY40547.1 ribosomal protein L6 [Thalassionema frauenfeldii]UHY40935.1 ribosomal protein L6 [Thalassionema frauenfeldii]
MSRIGRLSIPIASNVDIAYKDSILIVKGPHGTLKTTIPETLELVENENTIQVHAKKNTKKVKSLHGLYRTIISNMIIGVSEQFQTTLILNGVGYRGAVKGKELHLNLGYSHTIELLIPQSITVEVVQNTTINIKSCDKELLGLYAASVRSWRPPEPYKGKGILYKDEQILRKAGKSGK